MAPTASSPARLCTHRPAGYSGTDSFSYTISDGHGGTSTATVTVTVTALPVVPLWFRLFLWLRLRPPLLTTPQPPRSDCQSTINVLANDSSGTVGTAPTIVAGSITSPIDSSGTTRGAVSVVGGQLVFVPSLGFAGTVTFSYSVTNALGGTSTASVTVTVKALAVATARLPSQCRGHWLGQRQPGCRGRRLTDR